MNTMHSEAGPGQPEIMYCAAHPEVETGLSCGRCGTPICPRCMVQTPVGAHCPACARPAPIPGLVASPIEYGRAACAALGVALVMGVVWGLLPWRGYGNFIITASIGYVAGEVVSRVAKRRSSLALQVIAGATVFVAYVTSAVAALWPQLSALPPAAFVGALVRAVTLSLTGSGFIMLALALGIYIAVTRINRWRS